MGECSCWSVGAWTSLAMGVVSTGLLVAAMVRLGMARRQLLRLARERDAAREALLDATIRREVAEAERREAPDPLVAMSFAAARTTRLKVGMSVMVLPGRNPIVLAKELATLDRMSNGRLLPAFGLGVADPQEQQAFGVERAKRARM